MKKKDDLRNDFINTPADSTPYKCDYIPEEISDVNDDEVLEILIYLIKNIDDMKLIKSNSNVVVLEKYFNVEEMIESHLKSKKLSKSAYKFFIKYSRNLLKESFDNYDYSEEVSSLIEKNFSSFISIEIEKQNEQIISAFKKLEVEVNKHIKELTLLYFSIFKNSFVDTTKIPYFLLKPYKIQLAIKFTKIAKTYIDNKLFYTNLDYKYKKEINLLTELYREIIDNKKNLFHENMYDFETRKLLFKLLILSNVETFKKNEHSYAIFLNNLKKYLILMNILQMEDNTTISYYVELLSKLMNSSTKEITKEINNLMFLLNNIFNNSKDDKYYYFLFIILSFSLMMNNFFFALNKGHEKDDIQNDFTLLDGSVFKVEFVPDFKYFCSAREKEFLNNILNCLSNSLEFSNSKSKRNASEINLYLEAIVFFDTFQYYSRALFDKNTKIKLTMDYQKILSLITESVKNSIILEEIWKRLYSELSKSKKSAFKNLITNISGFINIFKRKSVIKEEKKENESIENEVNIDIEWLKLSYYNPKMVTSKVYIFISGFNVKEPERLWEKIIYKYSNIIDMYFYEWESPSCKSSDLYKYFAKFLVKYFSTNSNSLTLFNEFEKFNKENQNIFKTSKYKTKVFGELLAFILITKSIFKYHSINLVAFSIGASVIKHCLKTLNLFFNSVPETFDIIQDIVFIGGITDFKNNTKWNDIFKLVGGRIINVYSDRDSFLKSFFSKHHNQPIGISPIVNNNKQIENYDLTEEKIEHYNYQDKMDKIFEKIKIL